MSAAFSSRERELRVAPRLTPAELTDLRASARSTRQSLAAYAKSLIEADLLRDPRPRTERSPEDGAQSPCPILIRLTEEQLARVGYRATHCRLSLSSYVEMLLVDVLQID